MRRRASDRESKAGAVPEPSPGKDWGNRLGERDAIGDILFQEARDDQVG